jgi:hypothetical protein
LCIDMTAPEAAQGRYGHFGLVRVTALEARRALAKARGLVREPDARESPVWLDARDVEAELLSNH